MYLYIYDECVQDKKYLRDIALIENRLTDLGIAGKIIRMALFRQAGEQVRDEARRGASTVVVVGNDQTVSQILSATVAADLPLGIIPIGPHNRLAKMFGIPEGVSACDVLSARTIERLDTGRVNKTCFVSGLRYDHPGAVLTCNESYQVQAEEGGQIEIRNLIPIDSLYFSDCSNPTDGLLEARIVVAKGGVFSKRLHASKLPIHTATIDAEEQMTVFCDGLPLQGKHFAIAIEPQSLKVITGRTRMF